MEIAHGRAGRSRRRDPLAHQATAFPRRAGLLPPHRAPRRLGALPAAAQQHGEGRQQPPSIMVRLDEVHDLGGELGERAEVDATDLVA